MVKAVIGASYGDEGKGLVTDWLAEKDGYVIRYNGGHQAAHRVVTRDKEHIFSSFGSGTFKGAITIIGENCTFDPIAFVNECNILKSKGITPRVMIHPKCQVVTPYDKIANKAGEYLKNSTCGSGFGATKKRVEESGIKFEYLDLFYYRVMTNKLGSIRNYYCPATMHLKTELPSSFIMSISSLFILQKTGIIIDYKDPLQTTENKPIVYEGAQGILLDRDYGYFPYVTRSNIISKELNNADEFYLVTRAYSTRHGNGPFRSSPIKLKENISETNVTNQYQGEFRIAALDVMSLNRSLEILKVNYPNKPINLVITCLDHLDEYKLGFGFDFRKYYDNESAFINNIIRILEKTAKLNKVYISHSPYSENIKEYNG